MSSSAMIMEDWSVPFKEHFKVYLATQVHFLRNVRDQTLLHSFLTAYKEKIPRITEFVEASFDNVTAVFSLPDPYRRRLRTTNGMERLNEEFCRRQKGDPYLSKSRFGHLSDGGCSHGAG